MESSWQPREKHGETSGFLLRALLVSLVAHALALAFLAPEWDAGSAQPPARRLEGHLLLPRKAASEPAASPVVQPVAMQPARNKGNGDTQAEFRSRTPAAAAQSVSPASTIAVAAPATPAESGGEAQPRASSEAATTAVAPAVVERGADAAGLRQFRLALAGEARRLKRYPEMARREGLSGTAEVRVAVEAGGAVRRADLTRSSGHPLLDAAALEMLGAAVARTSLPESLRGRSFAVLLPVVFEVED